MPAGLSMDNPPGGRPKINVFSPLPPVQSAICSHTLTMVAALQTVADVALWAPEGEAPLPTPDIPVVRYDPANVPWAKLNRADANVYNIGNNASFHRGIFDIARRAPGIMVLHDTRLQHFFLRYAETEGPDREFYLERMRRSHGLQGVEAAKRFLAGEEGIDGLVERFPMTSAAFEGALAAIVHNAAEAEALAAQTRVPVFHLPLVFAAGPQPERPARPAGSALRLIAFGFMGLNRRLETLLDALAQPDNAGMRLDIYGPFDEPGPLEEQIARLGLSERVQLHGYVPETELTAALAAADLAVNLRYPSMGEASASQLRIWDAGLPSLVTRTGWYAGLPEDSVFFVEPERELATILQHFAALRADPQLFRRVGLRGREVLIERHAPMLYARGLVQVVDLMSALHVRCEALSLSRIAAQAMLKVADLDGVADCADAVAEAIRALVAAPSAIRPGGFA